MQELRYFPKNQILSDIVEQLYDELLKNKQISKSLTTGAIAFKKEGILNNENIIELLGGSNNIVEIEVCPLSRGKQKYKHYDNKWLNNWLNYLLENIYF